MTYRFHHEARVEFDAAVDWYDAHQPGLGDDFIAEVYATVQKIVSNPHAFARARRTPPGREIRFLKVDRFEYVIYYEVTPSEVVILSVAHGRRGRQTWRGRLPNPPAP